MKIMRLWIRCTTAEVDLTLNAKRKKNLQKINNAKKFVFAVSVHFRIKEKLLKCQSLWTLIREIMKFNALIIHLNLSTLIFFFLQKKEKAKMDKLLKK